MKINGQDAEITQTNGLGTYLKVTPATRWNDRTPALVLKHGDQLVHGLRTYSVGTVIGCAQDYNEDPIARLDDVRKRMAEDPHAGHKLHWVNTNATVVSGQATERLLIEVAPGDRVRIDGVVFTLTFLNRNAHIELTPEEAAPPLDSIGQPQ